MECFMMLFVFLFGCSQEPTSTTNQEASKEVVVEQKKATNTAPPKEKILEKKKNIENKAGNISKLYKTQANNLVQAIEFVD